MKYRELQNGEMIPHGAEALIQVINRPFLESEIKKRPEILLLVALTGSSIDKAFEEIPLFRLSPKTQEEESEALDRKGGVWTKAKYHYGKIVGKDTIGDTGRPLIFRVEVVEAKEATEEREGRCESPQA